MRVVAKVSFIQTFDEVKGQEVLDEAYIELTDEGINGMGLLDSRGILRMGANNPPSLIGTDFSHQSYFQDSKNATSIKQYFTEFIEFQGVDKGEKGVAISIPVFEDRQQDSFVGVLFITLPLKRVADLFLEPIQESGVQNIFLLDKRFIVLWSPDKSLFGKNILEETDNYPEFQKMVKSMVDGKRTLGETEFPKFDKQKSVLSKGESVKTLFAFSPSSIGNREWFVKMWVSTDDAIMLARELRNNLLAIIGSVIFLIILSAMVTSTSVIRSTTKIKKGEEESMRIATILQESFIRAIPDIKELDIWVGYETAHEAEMVGGDFYDIFMAYEEEIVILIGDVAGKGVEATGLTETTRSVIRTLAHNDRSPSSILKQASKIIGTQVREETFVTALLITLNVNSGMMKISSAGHPPPIFFDSSVEVMELAYGLPLGINHSEYKETIIDLQREEGILIYTDGLTDARNDSDDFFGQERILDALRSREFLDSKSLPEYSNSPLAIRCAVLAAASAIIILVSCFFL